MTPMERSRKALNEWFGEGKWPPVHKLDALIASVAVETEREARAAAIEECIDIVAERAQELAEIKHPSERQMGAFDAVSALEDELTSFGTLAEKPEPPQ